MTDFFVTILVFVGGYYLYNRVIKPYILNGPRSPKIKNKEDGRDEDYIDYEEVD